ncbi:hydrolase [Paraconexibacter sp. AEG42_29]|uniref:Hydrolase n=1 Tax=Paraconexibacter sp. AEG42_29 TaxID=2997339 RepID=A0AAU7ASK4_9ACTN
MASNRRPLPTTRRELLIAGTLAASAAYVPTAWGARLLDAPARVGAGRFRDGVASGEPTADGITLWSRLTTDHARSGAQLIVAEDEGLTRTVATAVVGTSQTVDGSLKTRITGLKPHTTYYYAWRSREDVSPTGRTRTAPPADSDIPVRLAYSSCQNYPTGFFTGHADAAKLDDLDLYVQLGDYQYERASMPGNGRTVAGGSVDLASYRALMKLYRADKDLRELHRVHPWIHTWDDHEVANDYTDNAPAPSALQKAAGYRVSFEWMPRMTMPSERYRVYGNRGLGRMCDVFLLDLRQYRTGEGDGQPRRIAGRAQLDALKAHLTASRARWKIVGTPVQLSPLEIAGQPLNPDAWDGFVDERKELLDHIAAGGISNVVFLTGDIHVFMANQVLAQADAGRSIATEFVGGSVTSSGIDSVLGVTPTTVRLANPWIKHFNGMDHGYGRVDLGADAAKVTYRVAAIDRPDAAARTLATFTQPLGANDFTQDGGAAIRAASEGDLPAPLTPRQLRSEAARTTALKVRRQRLERVLRAHGADR